VDGVDDVVDGEAEFHRQRRFRDHVDGARSDHVDADDFVGLVVFDDLDEAVGVFD